MQAESSDCYLPGPWQGVPQPFSQHVCVQAVLRLGPWALRGYGQGWHHGQVRGVVPRVTWDVSPTPEQGVWGSPWVRSHGACTGTQTEGAAVLRAGLGFRVAEAGYIFIQG